MQLNFILVRFRKLNHIAPACKTHHTVTSSKRSFRHTSLLCALPYSRFQRSLCWVSKWPLRINLSNKLKNKNEKGWVGGGGGVVPVCVAHIPIKTHFPL